MAIPCETAPERYCKSAISVRTQYHDASGWLGTAVLTDVTWVRSEPAGLTVSGAGIHPNDLRLALWTVSGGVAGTEYRNVLRFTSDVGDIAEIGFILDVT